MFQTLKYFFITAILISNIKQSSATTGPCPQSVYQNKDVLNLIKFLKSKEGKFQLGSCTVEIQACDYTNKEIEGDGNFAADLIILDKDGFERYIPFFIIEEKTKWNKQILFQTKKAIVYRFFDYNFDTKSGSDERWDIEIVKKNQIEEIDYLEIGYSSQTERNNKTNKKWIACGSERENFLDKHPNKHYLLSKKWWLLNKNHR